MQFADTDLIRAFAEAVARPGSRALLIDETNDGGPWVQIRDAVASGRAFAVEPCAHMLAIDLDDEADRSWASAVRSALASQGCQFVEVASGREGHGHLWVLLPPGWSYEHAKAQMKAGAGDPPNSWTQVRRNATRPPLSPHRLGGASTIVSPGPAESLRLFRQHRPAESIPTLARDILVLSHPPALKRRRDRVLRGPSIYSAALAMVNARCNFETFHRLLVENKNEVTSRYHQESSEARRAYAERVWEAACKRVREHPAAEQRRVELTALRDSIQSIPFAPRTASNDRTVLRALVDLGLKAATFEVNASIRQLSSLTGLSTGGVQASLRRLLDLDYIRSIRQPSRAATDAGCYALSRSLPTETRHLEHIWPSLWGPMAICAEDASFLTDIFTNGTGLGLSVRDTWMSLTNTPTKTADIKSARGDDLSTDTIRRHLNRLHEVGLAGRKGHRWWRIDPTPEEVERLASMLGVRGKTNRRSARYEREQMEFRKFIGVIQPDQRSA